MAEVLSSLAAIASGFLNGDTAQAKEPTHIRAEMVPAIADLIACSRTLLNPKLKIPRATGVMIVRTAMGAE